MCRCCFVSRNPYGLASKHRIKIYFICGISTRQDCGLIGIFYPSSPQFAVHWLLGCLWDLGYFVLVVAPTWTVDAAFAGTVGTLIYWSFRGPYIILIPTVDLNLLSQSVLVSFSVNVSWLPKKRTIARSCVCCLFRIGDFPTWSGAAVANKLWYYRKQIKNLGWMFSRGPICQPKSNHVATCLGRALPLQAIPIFISQVTSGQLMVHLMVRLDRLCRHPVVGSAGYLFMVHRKAIWGHFEKFTNATLSVSVLSSLPCSELVVLVVLWSGPFLWDSMLCPQEC